MRVLHVCRGIPQAADHHASNHLQDAVKFHIDHRQNPFFERALFSDLEFLQFEQTLLLALEVAEGPVNVQLQHINSKIDANQTVMRNLLINNGNRATSAVENDITGLRNDIQMLKQACSVFASGSSAAAEPLPTQ